MCSVPVVKGGQAVVNQLGLPGTVPSLLPALAPWSRAGIAESAVRQAETAWKSGGLRGVFLLWCRETRALEG